MQSPPGYQHRIAEPASSSPILNDWVTIDPAFTYSQPSIVAKFGKLALRALRKSQKLSLFGAALSLVEHIRARAEKRRLRSRDD